MEFTQVFPVNHYTFHYFRPVIPFSLFDSAQHTRMAMLPPTLYNYFIIKSEIQVCVSSNYEEKISKLNTKHAGMAGNQKYKKVRAIRSCTNPTMRDNKK
jgi:hypothetical protein